jgi:hypothetical protein
MLGVQRALLTALLTCLARAEWRAAHTKLLQDGEIVNLAFDWRHDDLSLLADTYVRAHPSLQGGDCDTGGQMHCLFAQMRQTFEHDASVHAQSAATNVTSRCHLALVFSGELRDLATDATLRRNTRERLVGGLGDGCLINAFAFVTLRGNQSAAMAQPAIEDALGPRAILVAATYVHDASFGSEALPAHVPPCGTGYMANEKDRVNPQKRGVAWSRVHAQFDKLRAAHALMIAHERASGVFYDWVARCRFDTAWFAAPPPAWSFDGTLVHHPPGFWPLDDRFWLSPRRLSEHAFDLVSRRPGEPFGARCAFVHDVTDFGFAENFVARRWRDAQVPNAPHASLTVGTRPTLMALDVLLPTALAALLGPSVVVEPDAARSDDVVLAAWPEFATARADPRQWHVLVRPLLCSWIGDDPITAGSFSRNEHAWCAEGGTCGELCRARARALASALVRSAATPVDTSSHEFVSIQVGGLA